MAIMKNRKIINIGENDVKKEFFCTVDVNIN